MLPGQSVGVDTSIIQLLFPDSTVESASCGENSACVTLSGIIHESSKTATEIPVTNFGCMSQQGDLMGVAAQSSCEVFPEKATVFEDITPAEELPENVNMSEYMTVFQHALEGKAQDFCEFVPVQLEEAMNALPTSAQIPDPGIQPRPFPMRARLGGVSSFPADPNPVRFQPRRRLGAASAEDSQVGTMNQSDQSGTEDVDVFDEADLEKLTPEMKGGLDPGLKEAYIQCKRTRSLQPLLKEELRLKILTRRHDSGQGDIDVCFDDRPQHPMTEEECEKRNIRRAQNRSAAQRFRQKKKSRELELKQKVEAGQKRKAELMEEVAFLRKETARMRGILHQHLNSGECRLQQQQQDVFFTFQDIDMTSLCQQISDENVDGRPAFSS